MGKEMSIFQMLKRKQDKTPEKKKPNKTETIYLIKSSK